MSSLKHKVKHAGYILIHSFISFLCPVQKKKILCRSFLGLSYSDNPRAISEKMHDMYPEWKIVWAFREPKKKKMVVPDYVKCVRQNSINFIYQQATAGVWVDNYCLSLDTIKRKQQIYIQTWHGDRGMKKILGDMYEGNKTLDLYESKHCDLAVAGSGFGEKTYRSAFMYEGEVLVVGSPKNDVLINGDEGAVDRFREFYAIEKDTHLLLYAPTFRDTETGNAQSVGQLDFGEIIKEFEIKTGFEWKLLSRGHTGRELKLKGIAKEKVINVSDYEDSKYILLASDAVISDYGSVPTDFALLGRPVFFYVFDIDKYQSQDRSLHFSIEETPYWYATDQAGLIRLIKQYTDESVKENCRKILEFYETKESGKASDFVCDYIRNRA